MGTYSDDEAVDAAVQSSAEAYQAAQDALRANTEDPALQEAYRAARDEFALARMTARESRPGGIIAEMNE